MLRSILLVTAILLLVPASASARFTDDRYPHPERIVATPSKAPAVKRFEKPAKHVARRKRAPVRKAKQSVRSWAAYARSAVARPIAHTKRALGCAVNVNLALAEQGIRGTRSALAKSFLHWGQASAPVPGAVAVYHRGGPGSKSGHVAIVSRVTASGGVCIWNPSRRGWREVCNYHRRALAYRLPAMGGVYAAN